MTRHKQQVIEFLKSLETGDPKPLSYINPERYIQHNLNLGDGLAALEARLRSSAGRGHCSPRFAVVTNVPTSVAIASEDRRPTVSLFSVDLSGYIGHP